MMNESPPSKGSAICVSLLFFTLNACSLLSVERIVDPPPTDSTDALVQVTIAALETQIAPQSEQLQALATQLSSVSTEIARQATQIAYLATRGPAPSTLVIEPSTPHSGLVVGYAEIEQGKCCVGGTAGDEIDIMVKFIAIGLEAPVMEMRYSTRSFGNLNQDFNTLLWEPYTEEKSFTHRIPINWTGFYIRVQYRDALGNLSPIYSDEISVEGMPATTPLP